MGEHLGEGQSEVEGLLLAILYRASNAVERMFRRLKGYRRIAARCDRRAANFLPAVCIVAASATA